MKKIFFSQKVQKMNFDEFYSDLKTRGHKELSPKLLRDILDTLVTDTNIFHNVTADTIEFANDDLPDDMDQDSIEDMGAKVSSMADQEAMKGIKAEL